MIINNVNRVNEVLLKELVELLDKEINSSGSEGCSKCMYENNICKELSKKYDIDLCIAIDILREGI